MTKLKTTRINLSDTQLVILSAAAKRSSNALLPFPKSLRAKDAALTKAIGKLERCGLIEERPSTANGAFWRRDGEDQPLGLFLTDAGLAALDGPVILSEAAKAKTEKHGAGTSSSRTKQPTAGGTRRPGSKQDKVLKLLRRKGGATLPDICSETGWQVHSARGFLSGTVRKKLGLTLHVEKGDDGARRYRLDHDSCAQ